MAQFCLPKDETDRFLKALKDGTIDPEKLVKMSSDDRRAFFDDIVGKDSSQAVNQLFEQKMLLKDVQRGLVGWAQKIAGMKPEAKRDLISRIENMDERILNPDNEASMLKDLAKQKFGTEVSLDEVKQINDLTQKVKETRAALTDEQGNAINQRSAKVGATATPEEDAYGRAARNLETYVDSLKLKAHDPGTIQKIVSSAYNAPLRLFTFGHSALIPFTHARSSAFMPGEMKAFGRAVKRAYSTALIPTEGASARYERDMASLRSDPDRDFWVKMGLPITDANKPVGLGFSGLTDRAFSSLKQLRLDLAKIYWNKLPEGQRTLEAAKNIVKNVSHATGEAKTPAVLNKILQWTNFAPKLKVGKYLAAFSDPFTSTLGAKRAATMIGSQLAILAMNDVVNRYFFSQTGANTVNWSDPTKADWLRMKVGGLVIPISPIFETMKLPIRFGADLMAPKSYDNMKVVKTEVAGMLHPTLSKGYEAVMGQELFGNPEPRPLPFPGVKQLLHGDNRKGDPLNWYEYGARYTPIWAQPIAKELTKDGIDGNLAMPLIETFLTGALGEHSYPATPAKKPSGPIEIAPPPPPTSKGSRQPPVLAVPNPPRMLRK